MPYGSGLAFKYFKGKKTDFKSITKNYNGKAIKFEILYNKTQENETSGKSD